MEKSVWSGYLIFYYFVNSLIDLFNFSCGIHVLYTIQCAMSLFFP